LDLSSLTQPIIKLIEVITSGVGAVARPRLMVREARANAEKIHILSDAISEAKYLPVEISYNDEQLQITLDRETASVQPEPSTASLPERTLTRLAFQQQKKQQHLESILSTAAEELGKEENVSSEPVDEDWISRFFGITEDISTEQMQNLWGRILAGEVKRPGSYSLRTLEVLKNIPKEEAIIFSKVAALRVISRTHNDSFLINPPDLLKNSFDVSFDDLLLLSEIGLVATNHQLRFTLTGKVVLQLGDKCLIVESLESGTIDVQPIIKLTTVGYQLANLIPQSHPQEYFDQLVSMLRQTKVTMELGTIMSYDERSAQFILKDVIELPT